jgi:ppGpp synthetase/RelA/SpoT-type nucleotidyltranferase
MKHNTKQQHNCISSNMEERRRKRVLRSSDRSNRSRFSWSQIALSLFLAGSESALAFAPSASEATSFSTSSLLPYMPGYSTSINFRYADDGNDEASILRNARGQSPSSREKNNRTNSLGSSHSSTANASTNNSSINTGINTSASTSAQATRASTADIPKFDFETFFTPSTLTKNGHANGYRNLMPSWLRPNGDLAAGKLIALREIMKQSDSYLSQLEAEQVISAIKEASQGDLQKVSGAVDFCLVLIETMEMGVATLIAAAFHYCDAYNARQLSATETSSETSFSHLKYWSKQNQDDVYEDTARAIKIGQDAHQLIKDSARIKRAEMVASESLKSRPTPKESANIRKMLLTETHDWRALAIRSAASLYRLRGIYENFEENEHDNGNRSSHSYSSNDLRVAREALAIHAPLASRLGMHRLKNEIEGAAFRIIYRRQYGTVTSLTNLSKPCVQGQCSASTFNDGMSLVLDKVTSEVEHILQNDPYFTKYVDHYKVTARVKESYSLWKKMKLKLKADSILEVPDALALRVVFSAKKMTPDEDREVTSARERALCYYVQQTCTKKFRPLNDGRFKDYIARPKPNGYQSLHYTAVTEFENEQWPFEIQVRSDEMHHVAEFGLASHWDYKAQEVGPAVDSKTHYAFKLDNSSDAYLRSVQEWHWQQAQAHGAWLTDSSSSPLFQRDAEMSERVRARDEHLAPYLDALMKDHSNLAREHVFIFLTNENDDSHVLELPKGACILDALRESERTLGITSSRISEKQIIRNGSLTSVTQQLGNGDIIMLPSS